MSTRRLTRWILLPIVLMIIVLVVAALKHRTSGCSAGSVVIGVAQPLSGDMAALGMDMLNGATLAAEHINALGGVAVCGQRKPIKLMVEDDGANAEKGIEAANRLVAGGVVAVIGHLNSGVSIAAAPVYAQATVPQLAISTQPRFTQLGLPTTLRLVANDSMQAAAMASVAVEFSDAKRFAIVDDGTPYGKGLASGVEEDLKKRGHSVAFTLSLTDKTREFAALVEDLRLNQIDVLITTLGDYQVEILARTISAVGLDRVKILGGDTLRTTRMQKLGLEFPVIYATSPIVDVQSFPTGKAFLRVFRERFGAEPVYAAHYAYDAVHLIADALARNESLERRELLRRLKSFDGNCPVTNSVRFAPNGEQLYGVVAVHRLRRLSWELVARTDRW